MLFDLRSQEITRLGIGAVYADTTKCPGEQCAVDPAQIKPIQPHTFIKGTGKVLQVPSIAIDLGSVRMRCR